MKKLKIKQSIYVIIVLLSSVQMMLAKPNYIMNTPSKRIQSKVSFQLSIRCKNATENDTLILVVGPKSLDNRNAFGVVQYKSTLSENGTFDFKVTTDDTFGYWDLHKANAKGREVNFKTLTIPFMWEQGDSILMELDTFGKMIGRNVQAKFYGKGREKYECRQKVFTFLPPKQVLDTIIHPTFNSPNKTIINARLKVLEDNSIGMSSLSRRILTADACFVNAFGIYASFRDSIAGKKLDDQIIESLINKSKDIYATNYILPFDTTTLSLSPAAIKYLFYALKTESRLRFRDERASWIYGEIKKRYSGILRDELIGYQFAFEKADNSADSIYKDAKYTIRSKKVSAYLSSLRNLYQSKPLGNYNFVDTSGRDFDLSVLKGKVILFDIWFTGCSACSIYYNDVLSKVEQYFKGDSQVVFVTISIDTSRKRWVKSINSGIYTDRDNPYNFYTGVLNLNHPFIKNNNITGAPAVILADSNNRIVKANTTDLFKIQTLIEEIKKAK